MNYWKVKAGSLFKKLLILNFLLASTVSLYPEEKTPPFYNEILKYKIEIKGFVVGSIIMRTIKTNRDHLQINARIDSFEAIRGVYYIHGIFGALWDYKKKRSYVAYEDVYQGDTFQRRAYRYEKNKILVSKHEKKFSEPGLPHSGPLKKNSKDKYELKDVEYQDLLGVFYTLRSSGKKPAIGDIAEYKVLPAGVKKVLMTKIVDIKKINVPAFKGKKEVFHVKTGLRNPDSAGKKEAQGGAIFIQTTSPVDMYITNDENQVPVKIWTDIPFLGRAFVILESYAQPKRK